MHQIDLDEAVAAVTNALKALVLTPPVTTTPPAPGLPPAVPAPPIPDTPPTKGPGDGTRIYDLDWNEPDVIKRRIQVQMAPDEIVSVRFTTGPNPSPANNPPKFVAAQWTGSPYPREGALAYQPGVMSGLSSQSGSTTVNINFTVGPNNFGYPALQPNTTYYLNLRTPANVVPPGTDCSMFVDLLKPGRDY